MQEITKLQMHWDIAILYVVKYMLIIYIYMISPEIYDFKWLSGDTQNRDTSCMTNVMHGRKRDSMHGSQIYDARTSVVGLFFWARNSFNLTILSRENPLAYVGHFYNILGIWYYEYDNDIFIPT